MKRPPAHRDEPMTPAPARRVRAIAIPGAESLAPAESLEEAESELGMNEWIDPETGEPAEGQSPPHLQDD
jgi:hypothetical protein